MQEPEKLTADAADERRWEIAANTQPEVLER